MVVLLLEEMIVLMVVVAPVPATPLQLPAGYMLTGHGGDMLLGVAGPAHRVSAACGTSHQGELKVSDRELLSILCVCSLHLHLPLSTLSSGRLRSPTGLQFMTCPTMLHLHVMMSWWAPVSVFVLPLACTHALSVHVLAFGSGPAGISLLAAALTMIAIG